MALGRLCWAESSGPTIMPAALGMHALRLQPRMALAAELCWIIHVERQGQPWSIREPWDNMDPSVLKQAPGGRLSRKPMGPKNPSALWFLATGVIDERQTSTSTARSMLNICPWIWKSSF